MVSYLPQVDCTVRDDSVFDNLVTQSKSSILSIHDGVHLSCSTSNILYHKYASWPDLPLIAGDNRPLPKWDLYAVR